jgi:putative endonuclease
MGATYAQRKALGDFGERLAARELTRHGLVVLDRNWRCRQGEIDIVATDQGVLVVCEVKTRRGDRFGSAVQAITPEKASRLFRLGFAWCDAHGWQRAGMRLDVVTVVTARHRSPVVTHYAGLA